MFIPVFIMNVRLHPSVVTLSLEVLIGAVIYGGMIVLLRPTSLDFIFQSIKERK